MSHVPILRYNNKYINIINNKYIIVKEKNGLPADSAVTFDTVDIVGLYLHNRHYSSYGII